MKRYVIAAVLAAVCVSVAYAHSPSAISITINGTTVDVFVTHPVTDPLTHYIKLVTLSVNGTELQRKEFTTQNPDGQTVSFTVEGLVPNDTVSVYAVCSRFGDKRQEVTVK